MELVSAPRPVRLNKVFFAPKQVPTAVLKRHLDLFTQIGLEMYQLVAANAWRMSVAAGLGSMR